MVSAIRSSALPPVYAPLPISPLASSTAALTRARLGLQLVQLRSRAAATNRRLDQLMASRGLATAAPTSDCNLGSAEAKFVDGSHMLTDFVHSTSTALVPVTPPMNFPEPIRALPAPISSLFGVQDYRGEGALQVFAEMPDSDVPSDFDRDYPQGIPGFSKMPSTDKGLDSVNDLSSHLPINDKGGGCNDLEVFSRGIGNHTELSGVKTIVPEAANLFMEIKVSRCCSADYKCLPPHIIMQSKQKDAKVAATSEDSLCKVKEGSEFQEGYHRGIRDKGGTRLHLENFTCMLAQLQPLCLNTGDHGEHGPQASIIRCLPTENNLKSHAEDGEKQLSEVPSVMKEVSDTRDNYYADEDEMEPENVGHRNLNGGKLLTISVIDSLSQLVKERQSVPALISLINGYRAACHYGAEPNRVFEAHSCGAIQSNESFCKILIVMLNEADKTFKEVMSIASCNSKKEKIMDLTNNEKWDTLKPLIKSYLRSILFLLNEVSDSEILAFSLERIKASMTLFVAFPSLLRTLIKIDVHLWATGKGAISSLSFLIMRDMASFFRSDCFDTCFVNTYKSFIRYCHFMDPVLFQHIQFLRNSFVELCSVDLPKASNKAVVSIWQLAEDVIPRETEIGSGESFQAWPIYLGSTLDRIDFEMGYLPCIRDKGGTLSLSMLQGFRNELLRIGYNEKRMCEFGEIVSRFASDEDKLAKFPPIALILTSNDKGGTCTDLELGGFVELGYHMGIRDKGGTTIQHMRVEVVLNSREETVVVYAVINPCKLNTDSIVGVLLNVMEAAVVQNLWKRRQLLQLCALCGGFLASFNRPMRFHRILSGQGAATKMQQLAIIVFTNGLQLVGIGHQHHPLICFQTLRTRFI